MREDAKYAFDEVLYYAREMRDIIRDQEKQIARLRKRLAKYEPEPVPYLPPPKRPEPDPDTPLEAIGATQELLHILEEHFGPRAPVKMLAELPIEVLAKSMRLRCEILDRLARFNLKHPALQPNPEGAVLASVLLR